MQSEAGVRTLKVPPMAISGAAFTMVEQGAGFPFGSVFKMRQDPAHQSQLAAGEWPFAVLHAHGHQRAPEA